MKPKIRLLQSVQYILLVSLLRVLDVKLYTWLLGYFGRMPPPLQLSCYKKCCKRHSFSGLVKVFFQKNTSQRIGSLELPSRRSVALVVEKRQHLNPVNEHKSLEVGASAQRGGHCALRLLLCKVLLTGPSGTVMLWLPKLACTWENIRNGEWDTCLRETARIVVVPAAWLALACMEISRPLSFKCKARLFTWEVSSRKYVLYALGWKSTSVFWLPDTFLTGGQDCTELV